MTKIVPLEVDALLRIVRNFKVHDPWTIEAFAHRSSIRHWKGRKLHEFTSDHLGLRNQYHTWAAQFVHQVSHRMDEFQVMIEMQDRTMSIPGSILVFPSSVNLAEDPDPIVEMQRDHDGWRAV